MKKLLIANRGEIACRIMKTAKSLGWQTVAVYSSADAKAKHVREADEAYLIGSPPPSESYLRHDVILKTAIEAGVTAIHPGYGFLSENPEFAENCAKNNIVFVGPPSEAVNVMGLKGIARQKMEDAGVPVLPGINKVTDQTSHAEISAIGYPILIKPEAGGGGKGMKIVHKEEDLTEALASAKREALSSFGNDSLMLEKFLIHPRHIEIQVFADQQGNCIHLNERDCSLQRRHQKVVEESPAPNYPDSIRQAMGDAAVAAAKAIAYEGAGTIEFLLADNNQFYFMEMNTRLQVEHPVTEMVTGVDLVEWQLRIAMGESLPLQQNEVTSTGHAMEVRIYAEDPANDFLPVSGKITALTLPSAALNVRCDSGIQAGDEIGVYYDPMLMKLISHGPDRNTAMAQLSQALEALNIAGFRTNRDFLHTLINHPPFKAGPLGTDYLDQNLDAVNPPSAQVESDDDQTLSASTQLAVAATAMYLIEHYRTIKQSPVDALNFRMNQTNSTEVLLHHQGELLTVQAVTDHLGTHVNVNGQANIKCQLETTDTGYLLAANQQQYRFNIYQSERKISVFSNTETWFFELPSEASAAGEDEGNVQAPMTGRIVSILVSEGDLVSKGQLLAVLEAMKMEHSINAPDDGQIEKVNFSESDLVDEGVALFEFAATEAK